MNVVSSTIIEDHPQKDGRRAVRERHTFDDKSYEDVSYLAEPKDDVKAMLAVRAKQLDEAAVQRRAEQEQRASMQKARSSVLLTLKDDDLRAVLMLPADQAIEDAKADLTAASQADVAIAVETK